MVDELEGDSPEAESAEPSEAAGADACDRTGVGVDGADDRGDRMDVAVDVHVEGHAGLPDRRRPLANVALRLVVPAVGVGFGDPLGGWVEGVHRGDADLEAGGELGGEVDGRQAAG